MSEPAVWLRTRAGSSSGGRYWPSIVQWQVSALFDRVDIRAIPGPARTSGPPANALV